MTDADRILKGAFDAQILQESTLSDLRKPITNIIHPMLSAIQIQHQEDNVEKP